MGVKNFNADTKTGGMFFINRVNKKNKLVYNLRAESLRWDTTGGKNKWIALEVVEKNIDSLG